MGRFHDRPQSNGGKSGAIAISMIVLVALVALIAGGGAQAVTPPTVLLGTADQFAVLAGSGITNTGSTTITGDTGSSPTGTETGFAACPAAHCVSQTGADHNPTDATTAGAKSALTTAYGDAAGRTPTTVLTELAGQSLVAGVYSSADGTFGMTGTLVLDGANNADSVFIFQTGSTLTTGGTGNVSLIRGAQACNVFWQIGSGATLGAGSKFVGTIMAHDNISLGNGVTVSGRLLAGEQGNDGAVTLIHDTIVRPSTCAKQSDIDAAQKAADQATAEKAAAAAAAVAAEAAAVEAARATAQVAAAAAEKAAAQAAIAYLAAQKAQVAADVAAARAGVARVYAAQLAARRAATAARVARTEARVARAAATAARVAAARKHGVLGAARPAVTRRGFGFTG